MLLQRLTIHRNRQSQFVYRLCQRATESQSARTVVTATSQIAPLYHPAEVYGALRATIELKGLFEPALSGTRCPTATTSRGPKQTTSTGAAGCSNAGTERFCYGRYADEPISAIFASATATADVQCDVHT